MPQPLVSVVIPCYNQAHFLADAVESCVAQSWPEVEIIVVDDGSSDDFAAVAQSLNVKRRTLKIHRQPNAGVASARNAGIALAKGKYLQFLDADDYLHPDKFAVQVEILETHRQLAHVYCDFIAVDRDKQRLTNHYRIKGCRPRLSGNLMEPLLINGYLPPHCPLVRKEAIDRCGGFTPHLGGHADYEFWMRIAANGLDALFLERPLCYYRVYATSMSKDLGHMNASRIAALEKAVAEYPQAVVRGVVDVQSYITNLLRQLILLQEKWAIESNADKALINKLSRENQKLREMLRDARTTVPA